ncbi:MAG: hypothetical protein RBT34_02530 [Anaerolineaceae bacterium]|jgi:hypothetical protein|nr:hypothetical protein [Anaerolineaceae bacterium]
MKRLMNAGTVLLLYLSLFLNIERFDVQGWVPIETFVYVLTTLAVVLGLVVPVLRRQHVGYCLTFWMLIFVLSKVLIFNSQPLLGGKYTFITLLELITYLLAVYLTKLFTIEIKHAARLIDEAIVPQLSHQVYQLEKAGPLIETEFMRSRRYDYPICALVVEPENGAGNWPLDEDLERAVRAIEVRIREKYATTELAETIADLTRQTDFVIDMDLPGRFLLICPEINQENAGKFLARLQERVYQSLGVRLRCGVAAFPEDAPSFEGLLEIAISRLA